MNKNESSCPTDRSSRPSHWSKSFPACQFILCAFFLFPASITARYPQKPPAPAAVEGVVVDQNGAAIVDAEVSLTSDSLKQQTRTGAAGEFHFDSVTAPVFSLAISAKGFGRSERKLNRATEPLTNLRIVLTPAPASEQVTITPTRIETRLSDTPASVVVVSADNLKTTAAATLDDALRQVSGFSLFRRSGSRTANPTSQGVSLRGLGASGASRALVLADGVPLNDPFGGWVYWDRVPRESINQVEVMRGGASHLYGSTALGGVIDISTKRPEANEFSLEASYGNETTPDVSLYLAGEKHGWGASVAAQTFRTDGYVLVPESERGSIDTAAGSRDAIVNLRLEKNFGAAARLFGAASFFGESRKNGTPLQTNRTHLRQFVLGGDWHTAETGAISLQAYGGTEVFDQNFTAISADRNSESLTRVQRVPAQAFGLSGTWAREFGQTQTIVAGIEARAVRGASDELAFVNGRASSFIGAGGREHTVGVYGEDLIRFGSRFFLNLGARIDHWREFAAASATRPITAPKPTSVISFPDRTETAFSPQVAGVYKVNSRVSLLASGLRAFRAPTLNELYRSFRVGNVLTLANEQLRAERLTGGEAGVRLTALGELILIRATGFWNEITRPVANVTLLTTPALTTRQRQNLGRTRSRGVEVEADARLNTAWNFSAGYLFADATVTRFPANRTLEGLMIPQVPRHQFTFQARYSNASLLTVAFQGRASSSQFDDDQNLFRLRPYFTLDAFVSRSLAKHLEVFGAIENLFNQRSEVGKTPVTTLGPPILARVGFSLRLGAH